MNLREPVLLIGSGGMLGRAWRELLTSRGARPQCPDEKQLDLTSPDLGEQIGASNAKTVINCAAWTDVDGAEEHEPEATLVNGQAVGALAKACKENGALLVHYSTDYVFDGNASSPYRVDQERDPINAYGRSKAVGERAIEDSGCEHLLIRTSWLYAPWGKNFVRTIARLVRSRPELKVVDDQRGRPTSAEHLASASLGLIEAGARGTFHATDGGECTWHGFTTEIARLLGSGCVIRACSSDEFPRPAARPGYSVLDLSATESLLGPMPSWKVNLAGVIARLEEK